MTATLGRLLVADGLAVVAEDAGLARGIQTPNEVTGQAYSVPQIVCCTTRYGAQAMQTTRFHKRGARKKPF